MSTFEVASWKQENIEMSQMLERKRGCMIYRIPLSLIQGKGLWIYITLQVKIQLLINPLTVMLVSKGSGCRIGTPFFEILKVSVRNVLSHSLLNHKR